MATGGGRSGSLTSVYLGVREQLEGDTYEHAVIEFNFHYFQLTKYFHAVQAFTVHFSEVSKAQTDGKQVIVTYTNSQVPSM